MRFADAREFSAGSVKGGIGLAVLRTVEAAVLDFCRPRIRLARLPMVAMGAMRFMRAMRAVRSVRQMAGKIAEVKTVISVPSSLELAHRSSPLVAIKNY